MRVRSRAVERSRGDPSRAIYEILDVCRRLIEVLKSSVGGELRGEHVANASLQSDYRQTDTVTRASTTCSRSLFQVPEVVIL